MGAFDSPELAKMYGVQRTLPNNATPVDSGGDLVTDGGAIPGRWYWLQAVSAGVVLGSAITGAEGLSLAAGEKEEFFLPKGGNTTIFHTCGAGNLLVIVDNQK